MPNWARNMERLLMGGKVVDGWAVYAGPFWICWSGQDLLIWAGYAGLGRICGSGQDVLIWAGYAHLSRIC